MHYFSRSCTLSCYEDFVLQPCENPVAFLSLCKMQCIKHNCFHLINMLFFVFPFWQPYDVLALIPVIEGAGGVITDWRGDQLYWEASSDARATSMLAFL